MPATCTQHAFFWKKVQLRFVALASGKSLAFNKIHHPVLAAECCGNPFPLLNDLWNLVCTGSCDALYWLHGKSRRERSTDAALHRRCPLRQVVGMLAIGLQLPADLKTVLLFILFTVFWYFCFSCFQVKYPTLLVPGRPNWVPCTALVLLSQLCWATLGLCEPRHGLSRSTMGKWVYGTADKGEYPKKTHFSNCLCWFLSRHQELVVAV